jgi:arylsulfatase A-like enzyme
MSLHFTAPHWPWEAPGDQAEANRLADSPDPAAIFHYDGGTLATYAAIMRRLDYQIGKVMRALHRLRLENDTIVIFTSDNGGEVFRTPGPSRAERPSCWKAGSGCHSSSAGRVGCSRCG